MRSRPPTHRPPIPSSARGLTEPTPVGDPVPKHRASDSTSLPRLRGGPGSCLCWVSPQVIGLFRRALPSLHGATVTQLKKIISPFRCVEVGEVIDLRAQEVPFLLSYDAKCNCRRTWPPIHADELWSPTTERVRGIEQGIAEAVKHAATSSLASSALVPFVVPVEFGGG
jgi:hypothetical protein